MKNLIKSIFFDIILLYRNFFRFIFEKIKISIFSFLLGLVVSTPFFIIAGIIAYFSNIDWMNIVSSLLYQNSLIVDIIMNNPFTFFSVALFFILGIISLFFGIMYSVILLYKLSLNFIEGTFKLKFKKDYFNLKIIFNFFKLLNLNILVLLAILSVYLFIMFILVIIFGGVENIQSVILGGSKIFPIISFIIFIIFVLFLFYSIYRLIFSFIILIDNKHHKGAFACMKKSYRLTSSKLSLFRFIVTGFILLLLSIPFGTYSKHIDTKYTDLNNYVTYLNLSDKNKEKLKKSSKVYYYNKLNLEYSSYSQEKILSEISYFKKMQWIYFVFSYLFLYGVIYMFLVSFYKRELIK